MSFIEKLKSVFVVTNDQANLNPNSSSSEQDGSPNQSITSGSNINISQGSQETFLQILADVLEKNNQAGFDYLEFRKAVQSISKLHTMEESTQFKTAFAAAQAMNVQPSNLIDSAKKYLLILEAENTQFNQTANQFLQEQLSSKENESSQLKDLIQQKEKQLSQLQEELEKHTKRLLDIEKELTGAKSKVESNKASFVGSYNQLVGQIRADIQKMEQYLK